MWVSGCLWLNTEARGGDLHIGRPGLRGAGFETVRGWQTTAVFVGRNDDLAFLLPGDNAVHFFAQVFVFIIVHVILL
jgi:hypothetical protein